MSYPYAYHGRGPRLSVNVNYNAPHRSMLGGACGSPLAGGGNEQAMLGMAAGLGMAMGLMMGEAMSGALSGESGCCCARGDRLSRMLEEAYQPEEAQKSGDNYGELEVKQKESKKGKEVPPDISYKGDVSQLPEILRALKEKG